MFFKNNILCVFLFTIATAGFSQEKAKNITAKKTLPKSIYTSSTQTFDLNRKYQINKNLNLTSFKFVQLNFKDIEDGYFSASYSNLNKKPSKYIFDDYIKIYRNRTFKQNFFEGFDLNKLPFTERNK